MTGVDVVATRPAPPDHAGTAPHPAGSYPRHHGEAAERDGEAVRCLDAAVAGIGRVVAAAAHPPTRVVVHCGQARVEVEWAPPSAAAGVTPAVPASLPAGAPPGPAPEPDDTVVITSPMVGTFYRAPAPGAPPFVTVGDTVHPGQQVAIVEAMKLMNAVTADTAGEVVAVLVEDGAPVEYGQPLVRLRPVEE